MTALAKQPNTAAFIADTNLERGQALERTLRETRLNVKLIQVSVTDWTSVISLFRGAFVWLQETDGQDRTIDYVVKCAGVNSEEVDFIPV